MHDYEKPDENDELLIYNFNAVKVPNLYFKQVIYIDNCDIGNFIIFHDNSYNLLDGSRSSSNPLKV